MPINIKHFPLVSIIVNCYNGETYLADAIKSVLFQSYKNFEIIFWDNQSKDKIATKNINLL
jgi:glycosyltransferase involved in cell wall biosynthesis